MDDETRAPIGVFSSGHFRGCRGPRKEPPKLSGRAMTEDRFGPERQDCRHPPRFHRERPVPHGVDPAMQPAERAVSDTRLDHLVTQPDLAELPSPHDAVLASRKGGNPPVKSLRVEFWVLSTQKSTRGFHAPDAGKEMRAGGAQNVPT